MRSRRHVQVSTVSHVAGGVSNRARTGHTPRFCQLGCRNSSPDRSSSAASFGACRGEFYRCVGLRSSVIDQPDSLIALVVAMCRHGDSGLCVWRSTSNRKLVVTVGKLRPSCRDRRCATRVPFLALPLLADRSSLSSRSFCRRVATVRCSVAPFPPSLDFATW
jgi:hypothetical protein